MKKIFKEILDANIEWQNDPEGMYQTIFQGHVVKLRFNNWPDEVLCTLSIGEDKQNWDDFPLKNWKHPKRKARE